MQKKIFATLQLATVVCHSQLHNSSNYAALVEPSSPQQSNFSSQPLHSSQHTRAGGQKTVGQVNIDTKYPDVMENDLKVPNFNNDGSDGARTVVVNSMSDDKKGISKLGEIVSKFTSSIPLAQQYTSKERSYQQLYGSDIPYNIPPAQDFQPSETTEKPRFMSMDPVQNDLKLLGVKPPEPDDYNIHIPPLPKEGGPMLVSISISLRNFLEIDELRQLITLETTMRLYWQDDRLNVSHLLPDNPYSNASDDYVLLHPDTAHYIWFPDIYIDFAKDLRIPKFMIAPASLRIYRNSTARYATQNNYDVACPMNFRKYPYDTQICKVKYESYGYTTQKMLLKWKKGFDQSKVTANNSISLAQFDYAVKFEEEYREAIASGEYPGVIMTIVLRRKINYHLLQTYLPSGLFVIVAWLSLFLPPEAIPGRVAMAMTTLLTLSAMFGSVRQNTPRVSYVSALDIWMCGCIIFVFFTLLEYVIVLCLIYRKVNTDEPDDEVQNGTASVGIQTLDKKEHNILQLEENQKRKVRARFCPNWRRRGTAQCRPKEIKHPHCIHKSVKKPRKPSTVHLKVEKVCRHLIAILFLVFNGIYWPCLMWDDGLGSVYNIVSGTI